MIPKISVIMSVYNKGAYLGQAIQSVLDQSFNDFEFIIRDNHSTDNSIEIITGFSDQRIDFAKNSRNLGPGGSLNNCIGEACGEYVVIAHGDDIWGRDFLAENMAYFARHPSINISHSLMHTINDADLVIESQKDVSVGDCMIEPYKEVLEKLFKGNYIKTPTVFIKRSTMKYFDIRYMYTGDWDLFLNLAAEHESFIFINKPLVYYRVSSGSETAVGMKGGDLVLEDYLTLRNFFNKYPEYRQYRGKSLRRVSESILRRSRDVDNRETLYFFLSCVILSYPLQVFNPVFHLYILVGVLFGPKGVSSLKKSSRYIGRLFKKNKPAAIGKSIQ